MTHDKTQERRSEERTKSKVGRTVVGTLTDGTYGTLSNHLFVLDISAAGMRINLDRTIESGDSFHLVLPLEAFGHGLSGVLDVDCEVVWHKPLEGGTCALGIKFLQISEDAQEAVSLLLQHWQGKHDLELRTLPSPVDAKLRSRSDEPWSRMMSVRKLSQLGFQFVTAQAWPENEEIQTRVLLEDGTFESQALVRWCEQMNNGAFSVGCEFVDLPAGALGFVELHLKRNL